jgi:hypothetical protein
MKIINKAFQKSNLIKPLKNIKILLFSSMGYKILTEITDIGY